MSIPDHSGVSSGPAQFRTDLCADHLHRALTNAMPESLGAALDPFMSPPETSSHRFSTEDLAEVLLVCAPIASATSDGLKCRRFW